VTFAIYFVAVIAAAIAVGIGKVPRRLRLILALGLLTSASVRYVQERSTLTLLVVLVWCWWVFHAFFESPANKEKP